MDAQTYLKGFFSFNKMKHRVVKHIREKRLSSVKQAKISLIYLMHIFGLVLCCIQINFQYMSFAVTAEQNICLIKRLWLEYWIQIFSSLETDIFGVI